VNVLNDPKLNLHKQADFCEGESYNISIPNDPTISYLWNTGQKTADLTIKKAGLYKIIASNACFQRTDSISIAMVPKLTIPFSGDTSICMAGLVKLNAGNSNASYQWTTGETSQSIVVTTPGTYTVGIKKFMFREECIYTS
jgi:hypothetical protein